MNQILYSSIAMLLRKKTHGGCRQWYHYLAEEITVNAYCIVLQSCLLRLQAIFPALFVQDRFSLLLEFFKLP